MLPTLPPRAEITAPSTMGFAGSVMITSVKEVQLWVSRMLRVKSIFWGLEMTPVDIRPSSRFSL